MMSKEEYPTEQADLIGSGFFGSFFQANTSAYLLPESFIRDPYNLRVFKSRVSMQHLRVI